MNLLYTEVADGAIGIVLLGFGLLLKDQVRRGWMILACLALQSVWASFVFLYNLWTLDGWTLLGIDLLWFVVLVAAAKMTQLCWRLQAKAIKRRDHERLRRTLGSHERIG